MENTATTYKDTLGKLNNSSKLARAKFQMGNWAFSEEKYGYKVALAKLFHYTFN